MELVFIFAVVFRKVSVIDFSEVVEVVRAFGVDAFVDDKVFAFFLWDEGIAAMGTAEFYRGEAAFRRGEPGVTDLTQDLSFGTVVFVEVRHGGITARAGAVLRDVTLRAAADGSCFPAIAFFDVGNEFFVSPALAEVGDERELVNLELLVFRGMGIIESPLFEWDISADEVDQPAVLLVKVLNKL